MIGYLTAEENGIVVFDVLRNDFHRPLINGKCNRENIAEQITMGILSGFLDPMTQEDVDFVCDTIDDLLLSHRKQTNA